MVKAPKCPQSVKKEEEKYEENPHPAFAAVSGNYGYDYRRDVHLCAEGIVGANWKLYGDLD